MNDMAGLANKRYLWLDDVTISQPVDSSEKVRKIKAILDSVPDELRSQILQGLNDNKNSSA